LGSWPRGTRVGAAKPWVTTMQAAASAPASKMKL
jgi:hypothetical protein